MGLLRARGGERFQFPPQVSKLEDNLLHNHRRNPHFEFRFVEIWAFKFAGNNRRKIKTRIGLLKAYHNIQIFGDLPTYSPGLIDFQIIQIRKPTRFERKLGV